jgi:Transcriptional regulator, AbiEi antitoxin/Protein of unknown function (DUF559)
MDRQFDSRITTLAVRQDQLFTRRQAKALGGTDRMIERRLASGAWARLHPGVYALPGAPLDGRAKLRAATLHLPDSVVSHEAAAEINNIAFVPRNRRSVTVPTGGNHRSPFATVHESLWLPGRHVTHHRGMAVTDHIRTLLDLSAVLRPGRLAQVVGHDLAIHGVVPDALMAAYETWTRRGRRRSAVFGVILDAHLGNPPPASELEYQFALLIRAAGLRMPQGQAVLDWLPPRPGTVDFAYPDRKLLIEVDGRAWHSRDADFDRDRRRDVEAALRGWTVLRFTWRQVRYEPEYVIDAVTRALALAA